MKINSNTNNSPLNFKGIYNNKALLKGLRFAAKNGTHFAAMTTLTLSVTARPIAIMATPKTDKENKRYAVAKSYASSIVNYFIMLAASNPIAKAIEKIDKNPKKYLKESTIKNLQGSAKKLQHSSQYSFATQLFKLGTGLFIAAPKSALTCLLIPFLMSAVFPKRDNTQHPQENKENKKSKQISFKGLYDKSVEHIAKGIGKLINTNYIQKASKQFSETNFAQHIMSLTDIILTLSFVRQTEKNKKIKQENKKPLIYNSVISTALCLTGGYAINSATNSHTEKFIKNFKEVNRNLPELEKYVEGIKIAKPVLILGIVYYVFIPIISTFFAERADSFQKASKPQLLR